MYVLVKNRKDRSYHNLYFVSLGSLGFPVMTDNIKEAKFFDSYEDAEVMLGQCAFTFEIMRV